MLSKRASFPPAGHVPQLPQLLPDFYMILYTNVSPVLTRYDLDVIKL